jgi:vacuolar iron transporter family protein
MGIGGFLASQAERDHYRYLRRTTKARVKRSCDGEVEREVHAVLGPVGVDQNVSRQVAHSLREVESGLDQSNGQASAPATTDAERGGLRWSHSVGVTEFLLKFGEGLGTRLLPGLVFYAGFFSLTGLQRRFRRAAFTCLHLRSGWAILSGA